MTEPEVPSACGFEHEVDAGAVLLSEGLALLLKIDGSLRIAAESVHHCYPQPVPTDEELGLTPQLLWGVVQFIVASYLMGLN